MSDVRERSGGGPPAQTFPLTQFIVALYKMTPEQRVNASAERAAERYGLPEDRCAWWINEARKSADVWPMRSKASGKKR